MIMALWPPAKDAASGKLQLQMARASQSWPTSSRSAWVCEHGFMAARGDYSKPEIAPAAGKGLEILASCAVSAPDIIGQCRDERL
jgi:hypothetical protein